MVAALTRIFGVDNLALAEDVAQDAICRALEVWGVRGLPENPAAWLMMTAKNRAIDVLRQQRTARALAPEVARSIETAWLDEAFADRTIEGEQLRMMFSCCHPKVPEEAQIALVLSILCGFGTGEIAAAFLTSVAAVEKRLARGKQALAESKTLFDLDDVDFDARLSTVQRALYLLFNEGYHGSLEGVRADLCHEAIRLTALLRGHPRASTPTTNALASLMCLHAARLPARVDAAGDLATLVDQDRSRWDVLLLADGLALLESSASGTELSTYHLEAAIASVHAAAPSIEETDWAAIVSLYDKLVARAPSPVIALARAIAIGQAEGPELGLEALDAIADRDRLAAYPFLPAARGTFELKRGRLREARVCFEEALALARNPAERRFLEKRARSCVS
jgi:RNA polymerase sigma-70 factor (ECF subfamily)